MNANGVVDAIRTHDASQVLQSLAVQTKDAAGAKLWPLQAGLQVGAGAVCSIGFFFADIEAGPCYCLLYIYRSRW